MPAPVVVAALAGLAAILAGIGVYEGTKAVSEARSARREENIETARELLDETNEHAMKGAYILAFRAARKYAEFIKENYPYTWEKEGGYLEGEVLKFKTAGEQKLQSLIAEYERKRPEAEHDDSGAELFALQERLLADIEIVVGPEGPYLKKVEKSFGSFYQLYKMPLMGS